MTERKQKAEPLVEQLRRRTWPQPPQNMNMGDYDESVYVREGRVFNRAMRLHQHVSEPIPPGESGITSLCLAPNGRVYGATSGKRSHLFYYDASPTGDGVADVGVLEGVKAVRRAVVAADNGCVYAGASEMIDAEASGPIFSYDTGGDYMVEYGTGRGQPKVAVIPVKGECVAALCCDPSRHAIYGLSSKSGTFFRFDYTTGKVTRYGGVSKDSIFSRTLVLDGNGNVYGAHSLGTLFRFVVEEERIEDLGVRIPTVAGRAFYNRLDSAVWDPVTERIYGAGSADGMLFVFDPESLDIRSLGKATAEPRVRAMAAAPDGRIYGISGCEDGMGHLFRYDQPRHELADLGILMAASEVFRRGFEFDAACTGRNGEIYFGENEWEGHLFIYFPPLRAPEPPVCSCGFHE